MTEDRLPCCECGHCHGPHHRLPMEAWAVAGHGELGKLAVHPDHAHYFDEEGIPIEHHEGWAAVG